MEFYGLCYFKDNIFYKLSIATAFAGISAYIGTKASNFARTCCLLPESLQCRVACRQGKPEDLRKNCSEVEEVIY